MQTPSLCPDAPLSLPPPPVISTVTTFQISVHIYDNRPFTVNCKDRFRHTIAVMNLRDTLHLKKEEKITHLADRFPPRSKKSVPINNRTLKTTLKIITSADSFIIINKRWEYHGNVQVLYGRTRNKNKNDRDQSKYVEIDKFKELNKDNLFELVLLLLIEIVRVRKNKNDKNLLRSGRPLPCLVLPPLVLSFVSRIRIDGRESVPWRP